MKLAVSDVESDTTHVLLGHDGLFSCPLEGIVHRVLDLVHELNSLGCVNKHIGTSVLWAEAPNTESIFFFPFEVVSKTFGTYLDIILWSEFTFFNDVGKIVMKGKSNTLETVVFVL